MQSRQCSMRWKPKPRVARGEPLARLIPFLAEYLSSFQIDKVHLRALQAFHQIINVIAVHLFRLR